MEKPSPTYDNFARYHIRSFDDDKRYQDRLTIRGIPRLNDTDEEDNKPLWRGDHTYSSDAASYSLTHFIEPEVQKEHPDWTHAEVKKVAVERFQERLAQDLSYEHKENVHEESIVRWEKIQTADGSWQLATSYGNTMVTLNELWEHTKEFAAFSGNPAAYNRDEHAAQIAMQEQLIAGTASGFVSVLSHPDAVRYVQVWQQSEDGGVISKQVDLYKTTGTDFTHEEGANFIRHLAEFHNADTLSSEISSYAHFFVREKKIDEEDIRTIAIAQTMERGRETTPVPLPTEYLRVVGVAARDSKNTLTELGAFLKEHIDKKINFMKQELQLTKQEKKRIRMPVIADAQPVSHERAGSSLLVRRSNMRHEEVVTTHGQSIESMKSVAAEWVVMRTMLFYHDVAPGMDNAIIYWLTRPLEQKKPGKKTVAEKNPVEEKNNRITASTAKEKKPRISLFSLFRLVSDVRKRSFMRAEKQKQVPAASADITPALPAKRQNKETAQIALSLPVVVGLLRLYKMLVHATDPVLHTEKKSLKNQGNAPERHADPTGKEIFLLRKTGIAMILWLLTEWERTVIRDGGTLPIGSEVALTGRPEVSDGEKQSTWLLFAIIWYLSAIREHGKPGTVTKAKIGKKRKKKKMKKTRRFLPPTGIIFTYGS